MSVGRLVVGMLAPYAIERTVKKAEGAVSFIGTNVISATFEVTKPSGTTQSWTGTISGATATQITVTHQFLVNELNESGNYSIRINMPTAGGGPYMSEQFSEQVEEF